MKSRVTSDGLEANSRSNRDQLSDLCDSIRCDWIRRVRKSKQADTHICRATHIGRDDNDEDDDDVDDDEEKEREKWARGQETTNESKHKSACDWLRVAKA